MLPKIIFKYSHVYNQNWQLWSRVYGKISCELTHQQIQNNIKKIEKIWEKHEKEILQELSKTTRLKWKEKEIVCYVVGDCRPFSDPLTLPVYNDNSLSIDVLIHELIHRLFSQDGNYEKAEKSWEYFHLQYKDESLLTRIHIPLNAILEQIYTKIFNKERLLRDISRSASRPDYKNAWDIVEKEGYKKIIKKFNLR